MYRRNRSDPVALVWCAGNRPIQREPITRRRKRFWHARRSCRCGELEHQRLAPGRRPDRDPVILGDLERYYLGMDTIELRVSHTGYILDAPSAVPGSELRLNEVWIGSTLRAVIVPVRIPRDSGTAPKA